MLIRAATVVQVLHGLFYVLLQLLVVAAITLSLSFIVSFTASFIVVVIPPWGEHVLQFTATIHAGRPRALSLDGNCLPDGDGTLRALSSVYCSQYLDIFNTWLKINNYNTNVKIIKIRYNNVQLNVHNITQALCLVPSSCATSSLITQSYWI